MIFRDDLGSLANPNNLHEALSLLNNSDEELYQFYKKMWEIRIVEEIIAEFCEKKMIQTPVHLGIGQEAIAVGVSSQLTKFDRVYSGHRSHAHFLALGGPIEGLLSEVLCRDTGVSRGMGGSMHLYAPEVGFGGSVPIVGGTIPIAVGAGLAQKLDGSGNLSVVYFGDGACEEGVLHESLNLAATLDSSVIFICENNLYSSHLDIESRQTSNKMARFADAHGIPCKTIDGNDVVNVADTMKSAVEHTRNGKGPFFIEAVTFRWLGHVGAAKDIDVGVKRSSSELALWMKRDPLKRLEKAMCSRPSFFADKLHDEIMSMRSDISKIAKSAQTQPAPKAENLLEFVYGKDL